MKIIFRGAGMLSVIIGAITLAILTFPSSASARDYIVYDGVEYTMEVGDTLSLKNTTMSGGYTYYAYNWLIMSGRDVIEEKHETNSQYSTITALKPGTAKLEAWFNGYSYLFGTYEDTIHITVYVNEPKPDPTEPPLATPAPTATTKVETTTDSYSDSSDSGGTTSISLGSVVSTYGSKVKITGTNTVKYMSCDTNDMDNYTIPSTVKIKNRKYKVTAIGKNAFKNCKALKELTIGKNVETIESNAFSGCRKLKTIEILSTKLKIVGKNALNGIHKKARIRVSVKKLKKYKIMLQNRGQAKSVKIGSIEKVTSTLKD